MNGAAGAIGEIAGGVAGGALGGVIGGFLGPLGAIAGRAIGSRVGRLAGRAAATALAQMMEDANEDAETETKDEEAEKACAECSEIKCFTPPDGADPEEFARQLKEQQDAINNMSPDELLGNMDRYAQFGRPAADAAARQAARSKWITDRTRVLTDQYRAGGMGPAAAAARAASEAASEASGLNATHTPDLVAGGDGTISGLGDASVNKSIGSQWGHGRADQLRSAAEDAKAKGKDKMDVKLEVCPDKAGTNGDAGSTGGSSPSAPSQGSGTGSPPTS